MSVQSQIPECVWKIIAVPAAILILSLSWFVLTYACVLKSAKASAFITPWLAIYTKVDTLDNNVQDIRASNNQLLKNNAQLVEQLSKIKIVAEPTAFNRNSITPTSSLPNIINNIKQQSTTLIEQQQKLEAISTELQSVKQQFQSLATKHDETKCILRITR